MAKDFIVEGETECIKKDHRSSEKVVVVLRVPVEFGFLGGKGS